MQTVALDIIQCNLLTGQQEQSTLGDKVSMAVVLPIVLFLSAVPADLEN